MSLPAGNFRVKCYMRTKAGKNFAMRSCWYARVFWYETCVKKINFSCLKPIGPI